MQSLFAAGARVEIHGHGGFPEGTPGTIEAFPGSMKQLGHSLDSEFLDDFTPDSLGRKTRTVQGTTLTQYVRFDQPTDDGAGDGPYGGSEILLDYLRPATG